MREVLTLQVGQAGNAIAESFWQQILQEHSIEASTGQYTGSEEKRDYLTERLNVLFSAASSGKWVPRSLCIDLEPATLDQIRNGPLRGLMRPGNMINGQTGAGNNFAKGHYTEGAEVVDECLDRLRKEVEDCDCPQGFQLFHSIGGGTGSGLGTLLLQKIKEEYPDRMVSTFTVLPSPKVSDTIVEPYNSVLAMHQLVENSDLTFNLDNEALYSICSKRLGMPAPAYGELNAIIAQTMSGITTTLRFPGQLNSDFRKLGVNLVPFPRLHFFTVGYAPLLKPGSASYTKIGVAELTAELFNPLSFLAACNPTAGKYLTCATYFRGTDLSSRDVEEALFAVRVKNSSYFCEWIPNSSTISLCDAPPLHSPRTATFIANNTAVQELFSRTHEQFRAMFRRKAFLYNFVAEGMDEMEFTEAESNLQDLLAEYAQYESVESFEEEEQDSGEGSFVERAPEA